ncbi:MAG: DUF4405 domain-containing protein [Planctomycetes bacterium]|nr:DUF4405 domain-containing protein [Planctomycetota bacterium]
MIAPVRIVIDWLDDRAGVRDLVHEALYESVPGGSRWRYVWGSTLVMAFVTQAITGIFLWMAYSPSTQTAWESVFYIEHVMPGGWLLRGIHHYMAQLMIVLLALHFIQIIWDGAYRAPRELNFLTGMVLMLIVLGLSFTGYLLPWDQKGYWATNVGTELASQSPVVGPALKKIALGGSDYGHQTLTRFFALHAGVLPALLVGFLVLHVLLMRRHGLHAKDPRRGPDTAFWPDQVLKDSVAALGVLAAVLALTVWEGAELMAPADPANPYNAARPEWYFLFLFQFLKWFPGELEIWGAFIIPGLVVAVMFLMPWIGRSRIGHFFNIFLLLVLFGGSAYLTTQALYDDNFAAWTEKPGDNATEKEVDNYEASQDFIAAKQEAEHDAERVIELALSPTKIPPTGALTLVYDDPYLQGPKLFKQHCAGCHNYETIGAVELTELAENAGVSEGDLRTGASLSNPSPTAPNLAGIRGIGSHRWVREWFDPSLIISSRCFGYEESPFSEGDMVTFIQDTFGEAGEDKEKSDGIFLALNKIAWALEKEANLPNGFIAAARDHTQLQQDIDEGVALITGGLGDILDSGTSCIDCHKFHDEGELGSAPDLTGYMSREWLLDFISNPADERFYGDSNDRMPAFAPHDDPQLNQMDQKSLELIVDWLRGDWYRAEEAPAASTEEVE